MHKPSEQSHRWSNDATQSRIRFAVEVDGFIQIGKPGKFFQMRRSAAMSQTVIRRVAEPAILPEANPLYRSDKSHSVAVRGIEMLTNVS